MLIVPLTAAPSQTLAITLNGQQCQISVYQTFFGLYMDLVCPTMFDGTLTGVRCENLNRIVRDLYLEFEGDFVFFDTQGEDDPVYNGLGSRFQLAYLAPSDL